MKKILKPVAAFAGLLLVLAACNKNENDLMPEHTANDPTTEKILAFKAKLGQADKIDETMSIDSAVWYIEAALNYTHCVLTEEQANTKYRFIVQDTLIVNASAQINYEISFENVSTVYDKINTSVLNGFANIENSNKLIRVVDVEYIEPNFIVYTRFDYGVTADKLRYIPDSWYWAYELGTCGSPQQTGEDATDIITKVVDEEVVYEGPAHYYTNILYCRNTPRLDNNPPSNIMFWYDTGEPYPDPYYCIDASDMNTYASETAYALQLAQNNWSCIPTTHTLVSWWVEHHVRDSEQNTRIFYHALGIHSGIRHVDSEN